MSMRFPRYGLLLAFLVLGATAGCDSNRNVGGPSSLSSSMTMGSSFGFQPTTLRPELVSDTSCVAVPAFGTRIIIIVSAGGDIILSGLRFRFTDRFGVNALPRVTPIPGSSPLSVSASTIPPFNPIPVPGVAPLPVTSPIPIPGSSPVNGLMVPAGTSRQLPFFLLFDCGVASDGTLFVMTDVAKPSGALQTSQFQVRVGS